MNMMIQFCFLAISLIGDVSQDPSDFEVQEVIYEEDISDVPDEEEEIDEDES